MHSLIGLYLFIWLLIRLLNYLFDEDGPASPAAPPAPALPWRDKAGMLRFFQARLPFLGTPEGAVFLEAVLPRREYLLRELIQRGSPSGPAGWMLEAVYYWYPLKGRRPLAQWAPVQTYSGIDEYFGDLIRYLFEQHPVPPVIARLWWTYKNGDLPLAPGVAQPGVPGAALQLYFYATAGGGLRSAPFLRWELSRGAAGYLQEAPAWMSLHRAYWYAQFRAEGMPVEAAHAFYGVPAGYAHVQFWRGLVRLWLRGSSAVEYPALLNPVVRQLEWLKFGIPHEEFLQQERFAGLYGAEPGFQFEGRSWNSLMIYLEEMLGIQAFALPAGMQREYRVCGPGGRAYRFVHIASPVGLMQEGAVMAHCVGGEEYIEQACDGYATFWSMRVDGPRGKRLLTIQLVGTTLAEVAGQANRQPLPEEIAVLEAWLGIFADPVSVRERAMP